MALPERRTPPIDNQLDGFAVEDHIGFLLRRAHQRHAALFVGGMAHAELTPTQFAALIKLVELGQATQNHLGRLTAMDPATIQGVVHRLTARGLMRRSHDPMDRRTAVLQPTDAGVALITGVVASARKIHAAALAPLTDDEQRQLVVLLRKMV